METEEAKKIVEKEWESQGECGSCGWHACLYEYGKLEGRMEIEEDKKRIWLPCLSGESGHRGVYIYYDKL